MPPVQDVPATVHGYLSSRKYQSFITMPELVDDVVPVRVVAELCTTAVAANNGECQPFGGIIDTDAGGVHGARKEVHVGDDRARLADGGEARAHHQ